MSSSRRPSIYATQTTTRRRGRSYTYTVLRYDELLENRTQPRPLANLGRSDSLDPERVSDLAQLARDYCRKGSSVTLDQLKAAFKTNERSFKILCSRQFGLRSVVEQAWKELGYQEVFSRIAKQLKRRFPFERVVFGMVLQHILDPGSKLRAAESLSKRVFFPEGTDLDVHHYYRALDDLSGHFEEVEEALQERLLELGVSFKKLVRDTTSSYFETDYDDKEWGEIAGQEDDRKRQMSVNEPPLRMRGYSKDKRPNKPQVVIQQVSAEGYVLEHQTLPGNSNDRRIGLEHIPKTHLKEKQVIASDAGLNSANIRQALEEAEFDWVLGEGRRSTKAVRKLVLDESQPAFNHPEKPHLSYRVFDRGKRRYVVRTNKKEADRQLRNLQRHFEKIWEVLLEDDRADDHSPQVCRLLSHKTYKRFVKRRENDPSRLELNDEAAAEAEALAGKSVISTNIKDCQGLEADAIYRELFGLEDLFRTQKLLLSLRPIRHRLSARIKAHIFVVVMASNVVKHLEKKSGQRLQRIRDTLSNVYVHDVELAGERYWECVDLTEEQSELFEKLGYDKPFKRFHVSATDGGELGW